MMTAAGMRAKVEAALAALGDPAGFPTPQAYASSALEAMCAGIIAEIQQNALVSASVTVTSVSAVQPGAGVSGPGAGTATGTIS